VEEPQRVERGPEGFLGIRLAKILRQTINKRIRSEQSRERERERDQRERPERETRERDQQSDLPESLSLQRSGLGRPPGA